MKIYFKIFGNNFNEGFFLENDEQIKDFLENISYGNKGNNKFIFGNILLKNIDNFDNNPNFNKYDYYIEYDIEKNNIKFQDLKNHHNFNTITAKGLLEILQKQGENNEYFRTNDEEKYNGSIEYKFDRKNGNDRELSESDQQFAHTNDINKDRNINKQEFERDTKISKQASKTSVYNQNEQLFNREFSLQANESSDDIAEIGSNGYLRTDESKSNSTGDKKLQGGERKTFNATEEFNGANSFGEIYNQREFDSKIREDRKRIIRAIDDILQSEFARQNISNTLRIFIEETKDFIRKKIREKNSFRKGNDNIQLRNDTGLSLGTENEIRKLGRRIYGESDDGDRKFTREYKRNNGIFTNEKFDTKDGGNFIEQNREIVSKPRESMEDGKEQNKLDNIIQKSNNDNSKDWTDTEDNSTEFLSDEIINNISSNERREKIFNNDKEFNRVIDTNSASNLQSSSAINNTNNKFNDVGISNEIDEKSNQSDMGNGEFKIKETQFNEGDENVNQGTGFNTEHRILQTETRRSGFKTFKTYEFLRRYEVDGYKGDYEINLSVKERIKLNLEAIKLTQKIFEENRIFANDEEKIILAKYSGFGGLKDLFYDEKYKDIKNELFDLVGEKYFKELKDSSDSAYYTPDFVIKNMYLGLENFGVSKNEKIKALEPSCGIGRFISLAPNNYEFEAIEKDTITATIAKFLHPNVKIYNSSFEKVNFTKEYDVIIGNPPYGNSNIKDISSLGNNLSLHNYFFVKSAEIVKPNGIVNFIISSYFLDSRDNKHRKVLNQIGNFIYTIRMPEETFKNSNTSVISDVVYFQKLENKEKENLYNEFSNLFLNTYGYLQDNNNERKININACYLKYSEFIIGDSSIKTNQFGDLVLSLKAKNLELDKELKNKIDLISKPVFKNNPPFEKSLNQIRYEILSEKEEKIINKLNAGSIFYMDNKIYIKENEIECYEAFFEDILPLEKKYLINSERIIKENKNNFTYKSYLNEKEIKIAQMIINFRDLLEENFIHEKRASNTQEANDLILKEKKELIDLRNEILDFTNANSFNANTKNIKNQNGIIKIHRLKDIIRLDKINSFAIFATEMQKNKKWVISDFFKNRSFIPLEKINANSSYEALQKTINEVGYIDLVILQNFLPSKNINDILDELLRDKIIFHSLDRNSKTPYILADEFLSGNVKAKYKEIIRMIENNLNFENRSLPLEEVAKSLKEVFPKHINYEDLENNFGANYIDIDIYENFIKDTFFNEPSKIDVKINYLNGVYIIEDFYIKEFSYNEEEREILTLKEVVEKDYNDEALKLIVYNHKQEKYFDIRDLLERIMNNKSLEVFHYENAYNDPERKVKITENIPTKMALDNAEIIKDYFDTYCFNNSKIRERIEQKYNDSINVFSNKKVDFSNFLETPYLNKAISLRQHQKNAIFKGILNSSLLLEHQVGAGKTLAGICLAMEQNRMGISKKALFLVPNHLTTQWGNEFLKAYPHANILIGDKIEDKKSRKEFLYRAKYGNYDAIIMKHSTFENMNVLQSETRVYYDYIENLRNSLEKKLLSKNLSDKEIKKTEKYIDKKIKSIEKKLESKAIGKKFDDEIAFEDLGIDMLVVDEAHNFKNLFIDTNQDNIKGLPLNDSAKAMKMFCATQYCHENNFKLYFLTGTPVSNSIAEFYIMQKYLQPQELSMLGLSHFDDWQKAFTKIVLSEELDSSGINYKIVSRLSKFINAPELMALYKQNADIVTNKDIEEQTGRLVPKIKNGKAINIISPRSEEIANYIGVENDYGEYNYGSIIYRMEHLEEDVSNNNMLKCTMDARKAALDYRLIDNTSNDYKDSKINKLVEKVIYHYNDKQYELNTQLIFCDLGVSKKNSQKIDINEMTQKDFEDFETLIRKEGFILKYDSEKDENYFVKEITEVENDEIKQKEIKKEQKFSFEQVMELIGDKFDVYAEILKKLVQKGINQNQIAFIGDANNDIQKQTLFDKVNSGEIRILIGSTSKMGAGTNVQKRIVALHELDCPWRPSDLEQRAGRVIRQGNMFFERDRENFEIYHYRYATEQTYDSRMFQINEQKLLPLIQLKQNNLDENLRVLDSIDGELANIAEMKAEATGNEFIIEKFKIENMLKTEERYYIQYKKSIIESEKTLKFNLEEKEKLEEKIEFLKEAVLNKNFEKENYDFLAFGEIRTSKKIKDDEKTFKINKEIINNKFKYMFKNPASSTNVLKVNDYSLDFRSSWADLEKNMYFQGVLINKYGKEFIMPNMFFKAESNSLFLKIPEIDGVLERLKNFFGKTKNYLDESYKKLEGVENIIFVKEKYLKENKLDDYKRKILLDTLKKDLSNINEIFRIRKAYQKQGIKIAINSPEIKDLIPKYHNFLDSKGKFKFVEEEASKEVQMNEKQEIVDNFKDEILSIQKKNKIEDNILTESVDFNDNTQNKSLEEKINLVLQMQKETEYIQRPKEILK